MPLPVQALSSTLNNAVMLGWFSYGTVLSSSRLLLRRKRRRRSTHALAAGMLQPVSRQPSLPQLHQTPPLSHSGEPIYSRFVVTVHSAQVMYHRLQLQACFRTLNVVTLTPFVFFLCGHAPVHLLCSLDITTALVTGNPSRPSFVRAYIEI